MKVLSDLKFAEKHITYGVYSALKHLEDRLQQVEFAACEGVPVVSIVKNENITHDGKGNLIVQVKALQDVSGAVPLYLRNFEGEFQFSNDGSAWQSVGTAVGTGDMLKSVYDADNDGRVDAAETVSDGTNTVTAAQLRALVDTPPGSGDMLKSVYDADDDGRVDAAEAVSDGTNTVTAAQIYSHLNTAPAAERHPIILQLDGPVDGGNTLSNALWLNKAFELKEVDLLCEQTGTGGDNLVQDIQVDGVSIFNNPPAISANSGTMQKILRLPSALTKSLFAAADVLTFPTVSAPIGCENVSLVLWVVWQ